MKVDFVKTAFQPVTVTLETPTELRALRNALAWFLDITQAHEPTDVERKIAENIFNLLP